MIFLKRWVYRQLVNCRKRRSVKSTCFRIAAWCIFPCVFKIHNFLRLFRWTRMWIVAVCQWSNVRIQRNRNQKIRMCVRTRYVCFSFYQILKNCLFRFECELSLIHLSLESKFSFWTILFEFLEKYQKYICTETLFYLPSILKFCNVANLCLTSWFSCGKGKLEVLRQRWILKLHTVLSVTLVGPAPVFGNAHVVLIIIS